MERTFLGFWGSEIQVDRDLKMGRFFTSLKLTNVSVPFRMTYLKD